MKTVITFEEAIRLDVYPQRPSDPQCIEPCDCSDHRCNGWRCIPPKSTGARCQDCNCIIVKKTPFHGAWYSTRDFPRQVPPVIQSLIGVGAARVLQLYTDVYCEIADYDLCLDCDWERHIKEDDNDCVCGDHSFEYRADLFHLVCFKHWDSTADASSSRDTSCKMQCFHNGSGAHWCFACSGSTGCCCSNHH